MIRILKKSKLLHKMYVNIACGDSFIIHENWVNLDYAPVHFSVKKHDLLDNLPFDDAWARLLYSSHFLEHIPRQKISTFLKECYRILADGAYIRLVLPDLESLCAEYLRCRNISHHDKANFILLELMDQCVRSYPGGLLGDYFEHLQSCSEEHSEMIDYVRLRCGQDLSLDVSVRSRLPSAETSFAQQYIPHVLRLITHPSQLTIRVKEKIDNYRIKLASILLPKAFREQNVSYASIGEKHAWMWDFYTLTQELERAGFHSVKRLSFDKTEISGFPLVPLDMTVDGCSRKGEGSMYIEAKK